MYKPFKAMRKLFKRLASVENKLHTMHWYDDDYQMLIIERKSLVNKICKARTVKA